jgi:glycosyltransferase involved in cell wall biosynthesis
LRVLVVTNMYPTPSSPAGGVFIELQVRSLRQLGVEVEVLHFDRRSRGPRAYWRLGRELTRAVERTQPALVHIAYGGVLAELATRAVHDRPLLVQYWGSDLLGSRAERPLRRFTIHVGVLASRRAALRASGVIVVSENLRAALPNGAAHGNVWVLASGIDLDRFQPLDQDECRSHLGWASGPKHVLFPASPRRPEKRYTLAQAAVEQLRAKGFQVELHALDGVAHTDVPTWMNASDVVLLTSTHEGSPNVVKEALACNVPVVAVDVGDVSRRLAGVQGCYVAAATTEDLAEKLGLVLSTGERVDGRAALAEISLERTAHKLLDIYRTILSEAPPGRASGLEQVPG